MVKSPSGEDGGCLDIFFFNDDALMRLDSYQRIAGQTGGSVRVASRTGDKIVAVLANTSENEYTWAPVSSFGMLKRLRRDLKEERREMPVMSAVAKLRAGIDRSADLVLRPLMARIRLRSISCDFRGREYENSRLENVKVYLSGVSSRSPLVDLDGYTPESWINEDGFSERDSGEMTDREMVCFELEEPVGRKAIYPDHDLFCYRNPCVEETLGTHVTRLIIQGEIEGEKCWYPLTADSRDGIEAGSSYTFDVKIRRKGASSPGMPLERGTVEVSVSEEEWKDMGFQVIKY